MYSRFQAVQLTGERKSVLNTASQASSSVRENRKISSETFGSHVFNRSVMQKMLPREVFKNLLNAMEERERIKPEYADTIAVAIKEWATGLGATHYTHWFQPLTGASAEKHDAFIDWHAPDKVIEKFSGKQLLQGEPDASSFPSGGLRSTYEARGYTGWNPSSPPFLWHGGDGITLCIPSIFFSWTGDVLDSKIPLLRSDRKINQAVLRLLNLTGISASYVYSTLGLEQEYFVIDRAMRNLRPDLLLIGRTVFGASPPKGQELQDHYFASVKDRILSFMQDFEEVAIRLGIPVKTRHNEVAPAQHEIAPVFEKASTAIDHNILMMELMRQMAAKHDLACLLHEKPFHGLNGSGKHSNWSLSTDSGINLLDPSDTPESSAHFLILLVAILTAIHEHATLLRASIGSAANDYRLGGHEAPPAIISVYLGVELEAVLNSIEEKVSHTRYDGKGKYDFGIPIIPDLSKDNTDRNRTSPFAFTGNKFEFRAVGSSSNPAFPITVLNSIVAESLNQILDEIEANIKGKKLSTQDILVQAAMPVLVKYIKKSKPIRFAGDNYSQSWVKEAAKRHLPNIKKSIDAFPSLKSEKTIKVFEGILNKHELLSRYEVMTETYVHTLNIEAKLMVDLFYTQIFPAAIKYQKELAESLSICSAMKGIGSSQMVHQIQLLKVLTKKIEEALIKAEKLEKVREKASAISDLTKRAEVFSSDVLNHSEHLREVVDFLETIVDDALWSLPKYREILFLV